MPEEQVPEPAKQNNSWVKPVLITGTAFVLLTVIALVVAYSAGVIGADPAQAAAPEAVNLTVTPDSMVIQLADPGRKPHFLKLSLSLGVYAPPSRKPVDPASDPRFQARLRDRLIFALSDKTSAELTTPSGRDELKQTALKVVREIYPSEHGKVLDLYVTELLIQ